MSYTVLARIEAPLQSWGVIDKFKTRSTQPEPSKSGIVGMVCCALGIDRSDDDGLAKIAKGILGVRIDKKGCLVKDFQTAKNIMRLDPSKPNKATETIDKYYLADASFLVGIEYEDKNLAYSIFDSFKNPAWHLCFGRKCCTPSIPVWTAGPPVNLPVFEALKVAKYPDNLPRKREQIKVICVLEDSSCKSGNIRFDQPLSFNTRSFTHRHVETREISLTLEQIQDKVKPVRNWMPNY